MTRATIVGGTFVIIILVLIVLAAGQRAGNQDVGTDATSAPDTTQQLKVSRTIAGTHEGLLYGRITTNDGTIHEGRLRWGIEEEALWANYFNGFKDENPWVEHTPSGTAAIKILGIQIPGLGRQRDFGRPFMARFGDITRIEPRRRDILVTLKSGTVFVLDRRSADDLADGVRVWESGGGIVDLGERHIRSIEFFSAPRVGDAPYPLHGTVGTSHGNFTGLVQWDREECIGTDELVGRTVDGERSLRFDTIRSIARRTSDSSHVTLLDGRELVLFGNRKVGQDNRGIYVDDERYGRVLISWEAFERVDFNPGGTGPAFDDYTPGGVLNGSVTTRSGRQLTGRLVYDLDESETTETLDAPLQGIDYTIPFGLIASIELIGFDEGDARRGRVILYSGEELQLERAGDLGDGNAGMLVFFDDRQPPEYVPWTEVEHINFDRPAEMYPPGDPRTH